MSRQEKQGNGAVIFEKIELKIPSRQGAGLKAAFAKVVDFLEQGGSLNLEVLADIAERLSQVAAKNKALVRVLEALHGSGDFFHVNLCHPDADILNLPWALAADPVAENQDRLCDLDRLFISKNPLKREPEPRPPGSGPLKILVMISSPKDLQTGGRPLCRGPAQGPGGDRQDHPGPQIDPAAGGGRARPGALHLQRGGQGV